MGTLAWCDGRNSPCKKVEGSFESSEPRVAAVQDILEELVGHVCGKRDRKPGVCQYLRWNGLQGPSDRAWGAARWLAGQRLCAAPSHLWEGWQQGEVCADTHPVCRPVPWYQIGKNGDGFSPVGARLFGCLRCGVCCIDAGIGPVELGGKSGSRLLRLFFFLGSVFCP